MSLLVANLSVVSSVLFRWHRQRRQRQEHREAARPRPPPLPPLHPAPRNPETDSFASVTITGPVDLRDIDSNLPYRTGEGPDDIYAEDPRAFSAVYTLQNLGLTSTFLSSSGFGDLWPRRRPRGNSNASGIGHGRVNRRTSGEFVRGDRALVVLPRHPEAEEVQLSSLSGGEEGGSSGERKKQHSPGTLIH